MDAERAGRMVSALRARGVMAHVVEAGVYEVGIRVVLDQGIEALWDVDGAAGLDAEIVGEGVLIGFVPHVPGSENFTEQQLVDTIATTIYSAEGLHPPRDTPTGGSAPPPAGKPSASPPAGEPAPPPSAEEPGPPAPPPPGTPAVARYQRRAHWIRRDR
ncbi:hypothetical protein ACIBCM_07970 [Streptomyces sp. NPDC051018]|uniref:hypothetical protein n=1 Tax=Streptomyces sp. NPDC051018 TaxID=3365639 RepID=UPI00379BF89A